MTDTKLKKALLNRAKEIGLWERYLKEFKDTDDDFKDKCPSLIAYFKYKQPKEYLRIVEKYTPKRDA
jgi:hypothetical protein